MNAKPTALHIIPIILSLLFLFSPPTHAFSPAQPAAVAASDAVENGPWKHLTLIPWGKGDEQLQEDLHNADPGVFQRGPGSMLAFEGGSFAILDTLGSSVKEFDAGGKLTARLPFPAYGPDGKATLACDMAAEKPGEYWVLSPDRLSVLHVKAGQKTETYCIKDATKNSILMAISRDSAGTLYVLDGYDSSLFRLDSAGHPLTRIKHQDLQGMALDREGHVYDLRLANHTDARHLELVKWELESQAHARESSGQPGFDDLARASTPAKSSVLATIVSSSEVEHMDIFGVDRDGNIYVTLAAGTIESPSDVVVLRFDATGKQTGRATAPQDPTLLRFAHGKVVSPDGHVYALTVEKDGLQVLRLDDAWGLADASPAASSVEAGRSSGPRGDVDTSH